MHFCVHETETWRFCLWHLSWRGIWLTPQSFQMIGQYEVHSSAIYFLGWPQDGELITGNGSSSFSASINAENLNTWLNVWRQRESQDGSGAMGMPIGWIACNAVTQRWHWQATGQRQQSEATAERWQKALSTATRGIRQAEGKLLVLCMLSLQYDGKPFSVGISNSFSSRVKPVGLCTWVNIWNGTQNPEGQCCAMWITLPGYSMGCCYPERPLNTTTRTWREMPVPRYSRMPGTQLAQVDFLHKHMRCCARNQSSRNAWNYNFIKTKCLFWPQPLDISETPEATS